MSEKRRENYQGVLARLTRSRHGHVCVTNLFMRDGRTPAFDENRLIGSGRWSRLTPCSRSYSCSQGLSVLIPWNITEVDILRADFEILQRTLHLKMLMSVLLIRPSDVLLRFGTWVCRILT